MAHNFNDLLGSTTVLKPSSIWFSDYKCWYLKDALTQFCNQKYKMNKIWGVWAKHTHFLSLGQKFNCCFLLILIKKPDAMLQKLQQINYWQVMESSIKWDKDALKSARQRTYQCCVNYPSLLCIASFSPASYDCMTRSFVIRLHGPPILLVLLKTNLPNFWSLGTHTMK